MGKCQLSAIELPCMEKYSFHDINEGILTNSPDIELLWIF